MRLRSSRLIWTYVATAGALLVAFAISIWLTQDDARDGVVVRFEERAARTAQVTEAVFRTTFIPNARDVADLQAEIAPDALERHLERYRAAYAAVLDQRGRVLAQTDGVPRDLSARMREPGSAAREALATGKTNVGPIVPAEQSVEYAVPIQTASGTRLFVAGIPGSVLGPFVSSTLALGRNTSRLSAYVFDRNRRVVGAADGTAFGSSIPDAALANAVASDDFTSFASRGEDMVSATAPLAGTRWRTAVAGPEASVFTTVRGARAVIPWVLIGALAIGMVVTLWILMRMIRSERKVEQAYGALARSHEQMEETNARLVTQGEELARSNAELEQFASIASHDLQEPLRKVQAFGEQLELTHADVLDEDGKRYLGRMRNAAGRMQVLIDDLLELARVTTRGRGLRPVELDDILDAALEDLQAALDTAGADVRHSPLPVVMGDRVQLEQLLRNLVSNAIKFRREDVPPVVEITATVEEDTAVVRVEDNGIGFDNAHASRIFEAFQRLHGRQEYPGTGIGLALCRRIVERHGGTLSADGVPGEGAVFTFTLVLAPAGEQPVTAPVPQEVSVR
ncbi:MAG: hypothetical protein JHC95_15470 [Solirubrobacteraceae bacterium]|nr:hypothetical protein [Solirubrobacteraceae bacterium]